jgi:hypothetical protein
MPDYDSYTKQQLADALLNGLTKAQLRDLVAWHLENKQSAEGGPSGGAVGSVEASNRWKDAPT